MTINQNKQQLRVAIILMVIMCIFLSGCSNAAQTTKNTASTSTAQPVRVPTNTPLELPTVSTTETPAPTEITQALEEDSTSSYTFKAELDYNKHTLDVTESIQYCNHTGLELSEISLIVAPNYDAGVFDLNALSINGDISFDDYLLDGIILSINLATPLAVDEMLSIELQYVLNIPLKNGILGYTVKQTNLSDWYPFVPPYDPETGWIIHQPSPVGEYLVYEMADFELTLSISGSYGLVVAASTDVIPVEPNVYQMAVINSRNLTFSVSDQYKRLTDQFGNTTVQAFIFEGDESSGNAAIEATGNALLFFSEKFGVTYPHKTMTIVEADFADGMEYDGLYYLSEHYFKNYNDSFENYLSLLSVHETAHQWWFGIVANDQALEPWLDESLATYSEYLFIENFYPELTDWWWDYRVDEYSPSGRVDLTIYDQSDLRTYINAVYLQGASFLHELRGALGNDAFFAGLRTYTSKSQSAIAHWEDFLKVMIPLQMDLTTEILQRYFK